MLPPAMLREDAELIKLIGRGEFCAVTVHVVGEGGPDAGNLYYMCRERGDDLNKLKARWSYYNAEFITVSELLSLPSYRL